MAKGGSLKTFAGVLEVPFSTVKSWLKQHEEFKHAHEVGEALGELFWERLGIAGVMGKIKNFKEKCYLQIMQQRFNWSEKHKVQHSGNALGGGVKVNLYIPDNGRDGKLKGNEDDRIAGGGGTTIEPNNPPSLEGSEREQA